MKQITLFLLLLFMASGLTAQNRPTMNDSQYKNDWKKVIEFEEKSLPQSAANEVDKILHKAVSEKNTPEVIKAVIHLGKYDLARDAENDTLVFIRLHEMLAKSNNAVESAVMHSMLGELYMQYYQKEQWKIRQRTELRGFVPSDMKEWTRNIFFDKVVEHTEASLSNRKQLEKVNVSDYAAIVEEGKDSRKYYPTMYDFLARRAIEQYQLLESDEDLSVTLAGKQIAAESLFAPAKNYIKLAFNPQPGDYKLFVYEAYRKHLVSLLERRMNQSILLVELDKLVSLRQLQQVYNKHAMPTLQAMLKEWKGNPFSVEVMDKIAQQLQEEVGRIPDTDEVQRNEKTASLYTFLSDGIKQHGDYERIGVLQNRLAQLTTPHYSLSGNATLPLKGDKKVQVTFKNLRSLKVRLYRISSSDLHMHSSRAFQDMEGKRTFVREIPVELPETAPYLEGKTVIDIPLSEPGSYMLTVDSQPSTDKNQHSSYAFAVSDLSVFSRKVAKEDHQFFVVDRVTGKPVPDAEVVIYNLSGNWRNSKLTEHGRVATNKDGMATYTLNGSRNNTYLYHAEKGADKGSLLSPLHNFTYYSGENEMEGREQLILFTDRSIYRPGQTLFYKGILLEEKDVKRTLKTNKEVTVVLYDANGEKVSSQAVTTNTFGSVAGEFVLPKGLLPGDYSLRATNYVASFRVEEYKRPTFEVTFEPVKGSYRFNEEVSLKGSVLSYSGAPIQEAVVTYRITRQQSWWWFRRELPEQFTEGTVVSDDKGSFEIRFTPEKTDGQQGRDASAFTFIVEATVTDVNGETQTGTYSLPVGDVSMSLQLEMEDQWAKESDIPILITAKNLSGGDISATGNYAIYALDKNDSIGNEVVKGDFKTGTQIELKKQLSRLPSGKYRVKLSSKDDRGNNVEAEKDLILFSFSDKRPPIETNDWYVVRSKTFAPGKPAEVIFGASGNVHLLYELWNEDKLLEREWLTVDNENKRFTFPAKKEYGEGVTLILAYVKDEKFTNHHIDLLRKEDKKEVKVKLDLFRDKIRPGSEEEWRITVTDEEGNPLVAELLASMYDFSLDQIYPAQAWSLPDALMRRYRSAVLFVQDNSFNMVNERGYFSVPWEETPGFNFDSFNWYDFSFFNNQMMFRSARANQKEIMIRGVGVAGGKSEMILAEHEVVSSSAEAKMAAVDDMAAAPFPAPKSEATSQVRRNFSETAFFYPQLRTNKKGETQVAFTVPESNTRWRFRVLAHDKELNSGSAEAFTVSQKELMVTPNLPRFLREGDRTTLSTKISNLSDHAITGTVRLELFNPFTEEPISEIRVDNASKSYTLAAGASSEASWQLNVPLGIDLVGVRIVADSEAFSDGEQHALAVLPNRMLVTESMRMDLNGNQTKQFTMDRLLKNNSSTAEEYRLTLEFASSPAWYAVQALPVLSNPNSGNAVDWFAAYYSTLMGAHIGKSYPRVVAMVDAWQKEGGTSESMQSQLSKNEELKDLLLEETPWVLEAKDETEQRRRLSLLFDLNRSRAQLTSSLQQLQELQTTQGGWSWFKGFYPSVSITHYILYGFNQLEELGALKPNDEILSMQSKALSYIDAEALRRFTVMKRSSSNWRDMKTLSLTDLEYLYVRTAYDDRPLDREIQDMVAFYRSVAQRYWTSYGLYERSLIAVLMHREGKKDVLDAILRSFREHATHSEELGTYWANNRAQVFMSQSAISVHTFIMDAFRLGGSSTEETDQMKRWLLKQKQTQQWESTHATTDAVYALLSGGSDWFGTAGKTTVKLGDKVIEPKKQDAGTGYFKESWERAEIVPQMGVVTVEHTGNGPAWGALYRQYFEEMDHVEKMDGSLDIEKLLFLEKTDKSGRALLPLTEGQPLNVGDKVVVRLTLRSDRDLEFVQIKDMRAAAFEPSLQLSGMMWRDGIPRYQVTKDASTSFYFDFMPRGTRVFEYTLYVSRAGSYSGGIATVQCLYAPEFRSHTQGMRINVKD